MRGASVYATLIVAAGRRAGLLPRAHPGRVLPGPRDVLPASRCSSHRGRRSTVTPALAVLLLRERSARRAASLALVGLLRRGYGRSAAAHDHARPLPSRTSPPGSCSSPAASPLLDGQLAAADAQGERSYWFAGTRPPGTSLPEMDRLTARAGRELRWHSGRRRRWAATSAERSPRTRSSASTRASSGSASTPAPTTTRRSRRSRTWSNGYPGLASRRPDVSRPSKVKESLTGSGDDIDVRLYGEELRCWSAQAGMLARKIGSGIDGMTRARVVLAGRGADDRGPGRPRGG